MRGALPKVRVRGRAMGPSKSSRSRPRMHFTTFLFRRTWPVAAGVVASFLLMPIQADACGGIVSPDGKTELNGFVALLSHDGSLEDLTVAVGYQGSGDGFAWMMPFPTKPEISLGDSTGIVTASQITTPPTPSQYSPFGLPGAGAPGYVEQLGRTIVGNLELVTLSATSGQDVASWMTGHGFTFRDSQQSVIQSYLDRRWVFVAARVLPGAPTTAHLVPLRFKFQTDHPLYPLAIAGSSHTTNVLMTLYVITRSRPEADGLQQVVVRPNDAGEFPAPLNRLELRYSAPLTSLSDRDAIGQSVSIPPTPWLTRFDANWLTTSLTTDLVLRQSPDQSAVDFTQLAQRLQSDADRTAHITVAIVIALVIALVLFGLAVVIGVPTIVILLLRKRRGPRIS
jgi:Uncharacterized protein conserved in bacteria (DUF2330)